ncbi:hypothetical protein [Rhodococcus sp. 14C212]|nr:hypothetical protein [Rhodococcus sp. 14C212]
MVSPGLFLVAHHRGEQGHSLPPSGHRRCARPPVRVRPGTHSR